MPVISETNIFGAYIRSDLELQTGDTIFAKNISAYNNFNDNGKYSKVYEVTEIIESSPSKMKGFKYARFAVKKVIF